jgi:hypothetical protein
LLFPAFAPAAKAGLRLLRIDRASARASGRASLLGALPLPRERLPVRKAALGLPPVLAPLLWPLRWPHAGAEVFAVRVPEAPWIGREPLAACAPADRAFDGRASELVRRAGRLPVDDCAGFRSLEWAAGRLKWGRAAAFFPLAAGLRAAEVRGAWGSSDLYDSTEAGETSEIGIGASSSDASSSWSQECRKYAEAGMEELV